MAKLKKSVVGVQFFVRNALKRVGKTSEFKPIFDLDFVALDKELSPRCDKISRFCDGTMPTHHYSFASPPGSSLIAYYTSISYSEALSKITSDNFFQLFKRGYSLARKCLKEDRINFETKVSFQLETSRYTDNYLMRELTKVGRKIYGLRGVNVNRSEFMKGTSYFLSPLLPENLESFLRESNIKFDVEVEIK
ncbi:MAG: hypothetical protein Q8L27_01045 [archaeon]|nr:hypothetical protein [archaeon]